MWKVKPPVVYAKEARYRPVLEGLVPPDPMTRFHLRRVTPELEFPDLSRNATLMGRLLTLPMYRRQYNRCTPSGVIFDDVIRPGLEEPVKADWSGPEFVGCVAGDAQSYILFCDFFDRIIEAFHHHKVTAETPPSDRNYDNLKGGDELDPSYAVSCELSIVRAVEDFCFPMHCSRGERRQLLTLARTALQRLQGALPGRLLSLEELDQEQRTRLHLNSPTPFQLRTGVGRDWPDARALWLSDDGSLMIWVNVDDHIKVVHTRDDVNIKEALKVIYTHLQKLEDSYLELKHPFTWKQQLGFVTSSPADVGTGLRVKVHLKLTHFPKHRRHQDVVKRLRVSMNLTESSGLYCVSNVATFGVSEVELSQLLVDGVKLIVAMETRLTRGGDIDDLVPTQK